MKISATIKACVFSGCWIFLTSCQATPVTNAGPADDGLYDSVVVSARSKQRDALRFGSCPAPHLVDMSRVSLSNSRTYRPPRGRGQPMTIQGDEVRIDLGATEGKGTVMVVVVPLLLSGEPDIDLKWARYEGKTFLYWRETFQHRVYRQGLLSPAGGDFEVWCEGQGGAEPERHWGETYIVRPN